MENVNVGKKAILGTTLLLLAIAAILSVASLADADEVLCSYSGPDLSKDMLQLSGFSVSGASPLREDDRVRVSFRLRNFGQSNIAFGPKGVFAFAEDPEGSRSDFGSVAGNETIAPGETIDFQAVHRLREAGEWEIWPSYEIRIVGAPGPNYGPDKWHACAIEVAPHPEPSPSPTPRPTDSPTSPPTATPLSTATPMLQPTPATPVPAPTTGPPPDLAGRFAHVTSGPIMAAAFADDDADGVLNYLDECPETPAGQRVDVQANGCLCRDSDGGLDAKNRGTITLHYDRRQETQDDSCGGDTMLTELSCNLDFEEGKAGRDQAVQSQDVDCSVYGDGWGCRMGECMPVSAAIPQLCFSADGSCRDGTQNQDETGVDCGGKCPPCNTRCTTDTKYAPPDTPCTSNYPTDPHRIDLPWTDNELELVCQIDEVCHPDLDYIVEEALDCCSRRDEELDGTLPDLALCQRARDGASAYCKRCTALYLIYGLGRSARWMVGYNWLYPEHNIYGSVDQAPAELLLNEYKTGVCRDYAEAAVTLLRKVGLSQADVAKFCDGGHCYDVVRLPGDANWHVVDTTGNCCDLNIGDLPSGHRYCGDSGAGEGALDENLYCIDGERPNGEECTGSEVESVEYGCQPGVACVRDLWSTPGWATSIENIVGCR